MNEIKLVLNHDYLRIIIDKKKTMTLPIRCAKIIKDMYNARNAKNESKDIKHYTNKHYENPKYDVGVMVMNAELGSELEWVNKVIKPLKEPDNNELNLKDR